jgi:N-acetylmuramoyl-L-alanine amidase
MQQPFAPGQNRRAPSPIARLIRQNLAIISFLGLAMTGMVLVYWYFSPDWGTVEAAALAGIGADSAVVDPTALTAPIFKPQEKLPVTQRVDQSPGPLKIGIIAGHNGNDSGAVCEDGLTEVQVTTDLAQRLAAGLQAAGIPAEILQEFDPKLEGYNATAVISIHADSCDYINDLATGFKISGSPFTDSSPLSICMEQSYSRATRLPYHPNSITPHMTNYHAFRKLGPGTPAIIIEVGFLNLDRDILTTAPDVPAEGLVSGVLCFLGSTP